MNKHEILDEMRKTKEYLDNLENMLCECECERWKPNSHDPYYYVDSTGSTNDTCFIHSRNDIKRFNTYNCFRTKEQADLEAEKILVRRMLENIARRLNKGQEINWNDPNRVKYSISLNGNKVRPNLSFTSKIQGAVCCLDANFKDVAILEIGEERLKKYLRGE